MFLKHLRGLETRTELVRDTTFHIRRLLRTNKKQTSKMTRRILLLLLPLPEDPPRGLVRKTLFCPHPSHLTRA